MAWPAAAATDGAAGQSSPGQAASWTPLHEFLDRNTGDRGYLGAVSLIARDGRIVDVHVSGHRDLARKVPMRRDSIFRIYSMTKPLTSVAVLQLMEQGKLGLDDPVSRHLPEFSGLQIFTGGTADAPQLAPAQRALTIRQLLTHTGGFATGGQGHEEPTRLLERANLHDSPDLASFSRSLAKLPLATEPGTRFKYDGTGIEVLTRLVEVVSGEAFDAYLHKHVLAPLKMRDTGFEVPRRQRGRIVDLTRMGDDGQLQRDDSRSAQTPGVRLNAYPSGAGGLYSTVDDYACFALMLLNGGEYHGVRLLRADTVDLMMRNQLQGQLDPPVTEFNAGEGFGLGGSVIIDTDKRGRRGSLGAFGWSGAASTYFTIDRERKLVAILLLQHLPNGADNDLPRLATPFYNLVYTTLDAQQDAP
ncbi:serine hydrolase domain-containing protein [Pseudoxanthomonas indica]|uniref:serine hydrolase domain-containing protein n=1 Tax=Pseudoxanthomonas indica TaxID=428993 RepID=UPI001591F31F|nr:serine hydrolase domain-containing protein [Pseudoxanthomonas indica]GGD46129.1 serine hydrolase [Pseudoxanthomonas indica]